MKEAYMIGIITFHRLANYGAILQAYALQRKIHMLGYESELIDYRYNIKEKRYLPWCWNLVKSPRNFVSMMLYSPMKMKRKKVFDEFLTKNTVLSELCITEKDLKQIEKKYKKVICGSDQIWSHTDGGIQRPYFLDFVNDEKKYSYAASFGVEFIPEELKKEYKKLLDGFQIITVREDKGAVVLRNLIGKDVQQVLDPTLLLTRDEWISLLNISEYTNRKYILIYALQKNKEIYEFAQKLSKEKNLDIINITASYKDIYPGIKNVRYAGPADYVELICNAAYVVTNSFHGIAFSLNFNTPFFAFGVKKPVLTNSRITSVLKLFELESTLQEKDINTSFDWNSLNSKLFELRQKSIDELMKICGE